MSARVLDRKPRGRFAVAVVACLALLAGACAGGGGDAGDTRDLTGSNLASDKVSAPDNPEPPKYGDQLDADLTIGYVISSGGSGNDFQLLANGGRVIGDLVDTDKVKVIYEDDLGSADGAAAAVNALINDGANAIVYASIGDQVDAGIKAASTRNVPVILPYSNDPQLVAGNANAITLALDYDEVADKLIGYGTEERGYGRFALIWDAANTTAVAQRDAFATGLADQGLTAVAELGVSEEAPPPPEQAAETPADEVDDGTGTAGASTIETTESLRDQLIRVGDARPDVLVVLGDSGFVYEVAAEWHTTGLGAASMISPIAAVPNLGTLDINALAPPLRSPLSVGIAGGPWVQTVAVMNYYSKRDDAKKSSTADLSVADVISADAALVAVAMAEKAGSSEGRQLLDVIDGLQVDGIGADYEFHNRSGVVDDDYAITAYNREESSANTYVGKQFPDVRSAGGFFVGLEGTASLLQDMNPFED